jgi:hypothetical protein
MMMGIAGATAPTYQFEGGEQNRKLYHASLRRAVNGWVIEANGGEHYVAKTDAELMDVVRDLLEGKI